MTGNAKGNVIKDVIIDNNIMNTIYLSVVLYLPEGHSNLLSISHIFKYGHTVIFNSGGCKVINTNNQHNRLWQQKKEDGMFKLNQPKSTIFLSKSSIKTSTWHLRLGHSCSESMK